MKNRDEVIAALSIEAPTTRMTDEVVGNYLELLKHEATRIYQEHH